MAKWVIQNLRDWDDRFYVSGRGRETVWTSNIQGAFTVNSRADGDALIRELYGYRPGGFTVVELPDRPLVPS